jgi:hypothetical protein
VALPGPVQPYAGPLGRHEGFGVTGERPATRPSVIGNRALGNDATGGVDANLTLDPVISDLDNLTDASNSVRSSLGRLRRIQPLGIGYGLDESQRVVGVGIVAAHDLLAEVPLDSR